jgi:hypothetical protein
LAFGQVGEKNEGKDCVNCLHISTIVKYTKWQQIKSLFVY